MNVVSVTELNEYIKRKFDSDFILRNLCVTGEISNYVAHPSGHSYFSLKDRTGVLKAVMFKGYKQYLEFTPKNGMSVTAMGDVNVFVRDGVYQLYVTRMMRDGLGELFRKYEELKNRLQEEGLFDEALKRELPHYPEKIGVITSQTGAVWHDIRNVTSRRYPLAELVLYPAKVQGEGAAATLIEALERANREATCDVLIVARGGGSLEDLWEFNDESLARAIRASAIPVVSAVGHETDFSIADFAADLRAPTPSAAAELCVPDANELRQLLDSYAVSFQQTAFGRIDRERMRLERISANLARRPQACISQARLRLAEERSFLKETMTARLAERRYALLEAAQRLRENDPSTILQKGYGIVLKDGRRLHGAKEAAAGDRIEIGMQDGRILAEVIETEEHHEV